MAFWKVLQFAFYVLFFFLAHSSESQISYEPQLRILCPALSSKILTHYAPRAGENAGTYTLFKSPRGNPTLQECVEFCCEDTSCNVVFMHNSTCFKIECESEESCEPVRRTEPKFQFASMVLIRPFESFQGVDMPDLNSEGSVVDETAQIPARACEIGVPDDCGPNEECLHSKNSESSICSCMTGYERNPLNLCVLTTGNSNEFSKQSKLTSTITSTSLGSANPKKEGPEKRFESFPIETVRAT